MTDSPEGREAGGAPDSPAAGREWANDPDAAQGTDTTLSFAPVPPVDTVDLGDRALSPTDQAAIEALPAGSALLVVRRGPNTGARFLLDADRTTAGRRPESDIFLDDVTVSRKHAEFIRREGRFVVRDVGSLNGTYVQRDRIDEAVLRAGDEVQIGKYRLVFFPSPRDSGAGAGW
jgi:pSer/pThr/pTyr-binding forkhead associated (FHA) protein